MRMFYTIYYTSRISQVILIKEHLSEKKCVKTKMYNPDNSAVMQFLWNILLTYCIIKCIQVAQ